MEHLVELPRREAGQVIGILDGPFDVPDARQIRPLLEIDVRGDDTVLRVQATGQSPDQRAPHEPRRSRH